VLVHRPNLPCKAYSIKHSQSSHHSKKRSARLASLHWIKKAKDHDGVR
jgi:hypothetical protein